MEISKLDAVKRAIEFSLPQISVGIAELMETEPRAISLKWLPKELEGEQRVWLSLEVTLGEEGQILV